MPAARESRPGSRWKAIWDLLTPVHRRLWLVFGLLLADQAFQILNPYLIKEILETLRLAAETNHDAAIRLLVLWLICQTGVSVIGTSINYQTEVLALTLARVLPVTAMRKILQLSQNFHVQQPTGTTMERIKGGISRLNDLLSAAVSDFAPAVIQAVFTLTVLLILDWRIGLAFLPALPIFFVLTMQMAKRVRPIRTQHIRQAEAANARLTEVVSNATIVQMFDQQTRILLEHDAQRAEILRLQLRERKITEHFGWARTAVVSLGKAGILFVTVQLMFGREIAFPTFYLYVTLTDQCFRALFRISRLFSRGDEWFQKVVRFTDLLAEDVQVTEAPDAIDADALAGGIRFDRVCFHYRMRNWDNDDTLRAREALRDVSFMVQPGEVVALVGRSGSGKTTAASLIPRVYDPTEGSIFIDGHDVRNLTFGSLRRSIGIVPQQVGILNLTAANNIRFAIPNAPPEDVIAAAKLANAHHFIEKLPWGYETLLGEHGVRLSGGEMQRVGIARALLAKPKILIFDEATSNLDPESEAAIRDALQHIAKGRTMIIIAHRLSTIYGADRILVFEDGRIAETGSHAELLRRNGLYAELVRRQAEGMLEN